MKHLRLKCYEPKKGPVQKHSKFRSGGGEPMFDHDTLWIVNMNNFLTMSRRAPTIESFLLELHDSDVQEVRYITADNKEYRIVKE